jgi:hypothetical protein
MRRYLLIALSVFAPLLAATSARATVVNDGGVRAGVALVPSTRGSSLPSGVSTETSTPPCTDPALTQDFWYLGQSDRLPDNGLCSHGGSVIHKNETFALTWDNPQQVYWSGTKQYVEQFLKDVASDSGKLDSPYAVTTQYTDGGGRAEYASIFGGGCIDHGTVAGSACEWANQTEVGHNYPANGCTPSGDSFTWVTSVSPNTTCLTDAQLQQELSTMVSQTGIVGRTQPGYTPLVTLLLPPGVETCLDAGGKLCSVNANLTPPPPIVTNSSTGGSLPAGTYKVEVTYVTASGEDLPSSPVTVTTTGTSSSITIDSPPTASGATGWYAYVTQTGGDTAMRQQPSPSAIGAPYSVTTVNSGSPPPNPPYFCSYHSQVNVGGTEVAYVVEPWTGVTGCDEPDSPGFPPTPTPDQLSTGVGLRLVSSLSQSEIAAIVNPGLVDGWFAADGSEIDDNHGCTPLGQGLDTFTIASGSYLVQREFNNAGVIQPDPNTYFGCAPDVILSPRFVVPSAVNPGDEVQFDGSITASTLLVPEADYHWSFGDGTSANGPAVVHAYSAGGTYPVTLTVTDRGGNTSTQSQTVTVLGGSSSGSGGSSGSGTSSKSALHVRILLLPQSLHAVLKKGVMMRVSSNARANGIAYVSIPRSLARRAHIKVGNKPYVVIGVGTVSGITDGTVSLHLKLSRSVAAKLRHLRHVTLTVRLSLVGTGGSRVAVDAAGRY